MGFCEQSLGLCREGAEWQLLSQSSPGHREVLMCWRHPSSLCRCWQEPGAAEKVLAPSPTCAGGRSSRAAAQPGPCRGCPLPWQDGLQRRRWSRAGTCYHLFMLLVLPRAVRLGKLMEQETELTRKREICEEESHGTVCVLPQNSERL